MAALILAAATLPVALRAADPYPAHPFDALVVGVHDGDTIAVLRDRQRIRVRLHGIDCPELGQPFGRPAIEAIAQGKVFYVRPWHLHVPLSAGGDTRKSSADKGKALIESSADNLAAFLVELSNTPWSENFPYPA